jgi:hypothetical protein
VLQPIPPKPETSGKDQQDSVLSEPDEQNPLEEEEGAIEPMNAPEEIEIGTGPNDSEMNTGEEKSPDAEVVAEAAPAPVSKVPQTDAAIAPKPDSAKPAPPTKPTKPTQPSPPAKPTKPTQPAPPPKPVETVMIDPVVADEKTPQTPNLGDIVDSPIEILHSIGDLHGWAPGLISYLINKKLATIEIDGYPLQDNKGALDAEILNEIFPEPISRLQKTGGPVKAGLAEQPGFADETGLNNGGHGKIKARWIAAPNVALIQIGDIYDRADHSELAAEILRQLIIDAPGRVFVMVGNHEQFMLENDYNNWYFNEARNAFTEKDSSPRPNTRNHFRFFPTWNGKTDTERAEATFERYVHSTWTLFLTQGAVMQKLGWIDNKPNLDSMLGSGWAGYENSRKIKKQWESDSKQKQIPGALTALVIGDTLFHHAEPAAHRTDDGQGLEIPLPDTMKTVKSKSNNILLRMYTTGGGALKQSPDAPLLWSRGSSSGASSGAPAAETHLEGLASAWKGLRRIIHGHTPTVGSGDFDSVTNGKSTTVSYLGDSQGRQSSKGRANGIRIYNIDEGMSPAYYDGAESVYSPQRMPTGLRLEKDELSPVEAKSKDSQHIHIDPSHSIDTDSRNLWRWAAGEWRNSTKPNWGTHGPIDTSQLINHGKWKGFISTEAKSGDSTRSLLNKIINATQIGKLMIEKMLQDILKEKPSVDITPPKASILARIPPVGEHIANGQMKKAWNAIEAVIVLIKENDKGGYSLICLNSTDREAKITIMGASGTKPKPRKSHIEEFKAKSVTKISINPCGRLFISPSQKVIDKAFSEWALGEDGDDSNLEPVLAHYSKSKTTFKKLEISQITSESLDPPKPKPRTIPDPPSIPKMPPTPQKTGKKKNKKGWIEASKDYLGISSNSHTTNNPPMSQQSSESREKERKKQQKKQDQKMREQKMREQKMREQKLHNQGSDARTRGQVMRDLGSSNNNNLGTGVQDMSDQGSSAKQTNRGTSGGKSASRQQGPKFWNRPITDLIKIGVVDSDYKHLTVYVAFKENPKGQREGMLVLVHVNNHSKIHFDFSISRDGNDRKISVTRRDPSTPIQDVEKPILNESKNSALVKEIIWITKNLENME